jgi:hypothetical protein
MYIDIVITGFHGITKALNAAEVAVMLSQENVKVQQKSQIQISGCQMM